ncbi:MAG: hypothetical protein QM499_01960 [Flavobacteriaceae bacterium]
MKNKILYISYTGIMEPLGESQVLNYIKGLSNDYFFYLITLEKDNNSKNKIDLNKELKKNNIIWIPLEYKKGKKNYLNNFIKVFVKSYKIVRGHDIKLIHCRSYMPGLISLLLKFIFRDIKYLLDTRGFWFDEKVDVGIWRKNSLIYKFSKRIESVLYKKASAIVMLSNKGKMILNKNKLFKGSDKVTNIYVIPTCTDLNLFYPNNNNNSKIKIGYVGTSSGWYDFDSVINVLMKLDNLINFKFIIFNSNEHEQIKNIIKKSEFKGDYTIENIDFSEIPKRIRVFDFSIFFIHPYFSKNASIATKLGELMASGIPVITNGNVGDHQYYIEKYNTGCIINVDEIEKYDYKKNLDNILSLEIKRNCRKLAEDVFSLQNGINNYRIIYNNIIN